MVKVRNGSTAVALKVQPWDEISTLQCSSFNKLERNDVYSDSNEITGNDDSLETPIITEKSSDINDNVELSNTFKATNLTNQFPMIKLKPIEKLLERNQSPQQSLFETKNYMGDNENHVDSMDVIFSNTVTAENSSESLKEYSIENMDTSIPESLKDNHVLNLTKILI